MNSNTALAVVDMAGTTVADDGLVEQAFTSAIAAVGVSADDERYPGMLDHVRATMGESKIAVFRHLCGDEATARTANAAFEDAYGRLVDGGSCAEIPGAADALTRLRDNGIRVALTTGFAAATQQALITALGWQDLADLVLCPSGVIRGRPYPDLALTALLRLGVDDVRSVATVGDTAYDVLAGLRAGAGIVAGVLTGAHDEPRLRSAGATHVFPTVVDFCASLTPESPNAGPER
jgi:phosphoglycolate phosphatase